MLDLSETQLNSLVYSNKLYVRPTVYLPHFPFCFCSNGSLTTEVLLNLNL